MSVTQPSAGVSPRYFSRFRTWRLKTIVLPMLERVRRKKAVVEVLDIGGAEPYWLPIADELAALDCRIVLLNKNKGHAVQTVGPSSLFSLQIGDGCNLDIPDNSFDLVHSNSVIEHVGRWTDMVAMAGEVRRLAPAYYVQTPNYWFPMEPHFGSLFIHWLPQHFQAKLLMRRAHTGYPKAATLLQAMSFVQDQQLLTKPQMRALFPDAKIIPERFCGFIKSIIAVRNPLD